MELDKIITIVCFVLAMAATAWGLYQKVKGNSAAAVSELIARAEETGLLGREKMELVVNWLYETIPAPFKKFLNKETLQTLAQKIFDYMKKYANAYIESKNGAGNDAYAPVNDSLASDVAKQLTGLSAAGLRALANNMGIEVTGKSDADLIKEIVLMIMKNS